MKFFSSLMCSRAARGFWYLFIALAVATSASADDGQPDEKVRTRIVPLIFSSENTGVAYGLGGVSIGAGQPQAALFALGFTSENDSKAVSVGRRRIIYERPTRRAIKDQDASTKFDKPYRKE